MKSVRWISGAGLVAIVSASLVLAPSPGPIGRAQGPGAGPADDATSPAPVAENDTTSADASSEPPASTNAPADPAVQQAGDEAADPFITANSPGTKDGDVDVATMSDAEKLVALQRLIETKQDDLEELKAEVENPDGEYTQAEAAFQTIDTKLDAQKEALRKAEVAKQTDQVKSIQAEIENLTKPWQLAKERFDLAIRERKALHERIQLLETTLKSYRERLEELKGNSEAEPTPTSPEAMAPPDASASPTAPETAPTAPGAAPDETTATPVPSEGPSPTSAAEPAAAATPTPPVLPTLPGTATTEAQPAPAAPAGKAQEPPSKELVKAQETVQETSQAVDKVRQRSQSIEEQLANIDRAVALQRELLTTAREKADNASQTSVALTKQFRDGSINGTPGDELQALRTQTEDAEDRARGAQAEIRERTDRLQELQDERALIVSAREASRRESTQVQAQLDAAQEKVQQLTNPLSLANLKRWTLTHGLIIVVILVGMIALYWFIGMLGGRVVKLVAGRGARGSKAEREGRAQTLVGVFENFASLAIVIGGGLMVLQEAGVPIGPLLGGAAVVGFAVGFGSQNLVRDYFSGFVILLENQYKLNDVVQIGDHSGLVERITMRMTALRDLEGNLHFIPNGEIKSVVNMTHGWSRALFDIGVAYKENVDHVMAVIMELAGQLRKDSKFRLMILDDPTMLGVDAFGDSAVVIKFHIKTLPLKQWEVKRELNRRIKNRFDELGIEIPFPHRTVFHRTDDPTLSRLTENAASALAHDNGATVER